MTDFFVSPDEPSDATSDAITPREELERLLATDQGRLGEVFLRPTMEPETLAQELNVSTPAFVYNLRRTIDALLDGRAVEGRTFRKQVLGVFNTQAARGRGILSPAAAELLASNRAVIEAAGAAESPVEAAVEAAEADREAATTLAELEGVPGIYAFSYGWYLESLVDPARGNTLIKVGKSVNVAQRIRQHTSLARTHMPEPLALIRVYSTADRDPEDIAHSFHELLHTAGHDNPRRTGREVGIEWFLTNEDFLDSIAKVVGLRTIYTGRSEFGND